MTSTNGTSWWGPGTTSGTSARYVSATPVRATSVTTTNRIRIYSSASNVVVCMNCGLPLDFPFFDRVLGRYIQYCSPCAHRLGMNYKITADLLWGRL